MPQHSSNRIAALDKLMMLAAWAQAREHFTAQQASIAIHLSMRTTYRYLNALMTIDNRLSGEAGVGYYYRKEHPHVRRQAA